MMRSAVAVLVPRLLAAAMAACLLLPHGQAAECSYQFSYRQGLEGTFASPGYPEKYPAQINCYYRFQAVSNGGVQVRFEVFNLEGYSESENRCVYDYIDVYAVDIQGYRTVLGRYCGDQLPDPITSPQSTLLIEFMSDYTKPSIGFRGHYTFLGDNWHPFEHDDRVCGNGHLGGSGGIIQSPNYPRPFPGLVSCSWLVRVRDDEQVLIMIDDLDIGTSSHCGGNEATLQIYFGYATNSTVPNEKLCGQMHSVIVARKREIPSPKPRVIIRFVADGDNVQQSRGFRLSWTAIQIPKEGPCPEFQCEGGYACGIEGLRGICDQLPRYCIHDDQRCNGIANCGQHDDSDERRCPREILIMTALITVPSLAILTLLAVAIHCYRSKKRRLLLSMAKSASQTQPLTASTFSSSSYKHGSSKESFNSYGHRCSSSGGGGGGYQHPQQYQQHQQQQQLCPPNTMMQTSFVDGNNSRSGGGGGGGDNGTLRRSGSSSAASTLRTSPGRRGGGGAAAGGAGGGEGGGLGGGECFPIPPVLPPMEDPHMDIDDQQLPIPISLPRPSPDPPNYRAHQKRASYTMMKQNFEDGNGTIPEI